MILLEDRNKPYGEYDLFTNAEQIKGSQTWLRESPSGLGARCHYYMGEMSLEDLSVGPVFQFLVSSIQKVLNGKVNSNELDWLDFEIEEKFNTTVSYSHLSDKDIECLVSEGFLPLLALKCPVLKNNRGFTLAIATIDQIKELEKQFEGKPLEEITECINAHVENENEKEEDLWQVVQYNYKSNEYLLRERTLYSEFIEKESEKKNDQTSIHSLSEIGEAIRKITNERDN